MQGDKVLGLRSVLLVQLFHRFNKPCLHGRHVLFGCHGIQMPLNGSQSLVCTIKPCAYLQHETFRMAIECLADVNVPLLDLLPDGFQLFSRIAGSFFNAST